MRMNAAGISPAVRVLPATYRRAVALELGCLVFEMSAAEAIELADQLVDGAEKGSTDEP